MKTVILRYGAYGDMIYTLPVVEKLHADGHDISIITGTKGAEIFARDPRFTEKIFHEPDRTDLAEVGDVLQEVLDRLKPELIVNLSNTFETNVIPTDMDEKWNWSIGRRQEDQKGRSFYELPLEVAGYKWDGETGTMAFDEDELAWAERWREKHKDQFIVLIAATGSNAQKRFPLQIDVAWHVVKTYPDAVVYFAADPHTIENLRDFGFPKGRVYKMAGSSFRQSVLAARYADFVIGPETGLLVGAGMWGTPKMMLCTATSVELCVKGHMNDFSVQAKIPCSPCLRAIYKESDCYMGYVQGMTPCNFKFNLEKIKSVIQYVHKNLRYRRVRDVDNRTRPIRVSKMHPHIVRFPVRPPNVRPGVSDEVRTTGADGARG